MAAPSYTTDLTDISLAESVTNWDESSDASWDEGGTPSLEGDYFIQGGSYCISATCSVAKGNYASIIYNNSAGVTVPTDGAVLIWQYFAAPNALDSEANSGQVVIVGSGFGAFYWWTSGGEDAYPNPYGGWKNMAVDPAQTPDGTVGSPSSTKQYFGSAVKQTAAISKGNPHGVDAIRYGRCEARFNGGEAANYATFAGFAAVNDTESYRWGLIQAVQGGFLWKGLITLGYSSAVDFRDSDVSITIDNTKKVSANFNKIEIRQAGSRVDWTRVSIKALGTVSKGRFEMVDNADVNLLDCQFTSMDTFIFLSNGEALGCVWLRCNTITAPGIDMTGSKVLLSSVAADTSAVVWDVAVDPDGYLDDMTFSKGTNAHHALELGTTSPTDITLRGWTTSGFNASNGQNDSTFHVKRTVGTVTINIIGGTGNFTYKSAGATVIIVVSPVTALVVVKDENNQNLSNARVIMEAADGTGDLPYQESVSITRSGSTATVSHTGHGMISNDWVVIKGANQQEYNGVHQITKIDDNSYSYTVSGTPDTPATGTIIATGAVLQGLTVSGQISRSRTWTQPQPVKGRVAKGTASPYYKEQEYTDEIDNVYGLTRTIQMVRDD